MYICTCVCLCVLCVCVCFEGHLKVLSLTDEEGAYVCIFLYATILTLLIKLQRLFHTPVKFCPMHSSKKFDKSGWGEDILQGDRWPNE